MTTTIELTTPDLDLLREVLAQALRELRMEIAHTDHREYREVLTARLERLDTLAGILEGISTRASASA